MAPPVGSIMSYNHEGGTTGRQYPSIKNVVPPVCSILLVAAPRGGSQFTSSPYKYRWHHLAVVLVHVYYNAEVLTN